MRRGFVAVVAVLATLVPWVVVPAARALPALPVLGAAPLDVSDAVGHLAPAGRVLEVALPAGTTAVGLTWSGDVPAVALRTRGPAGWSGWVEVEDEADHGDGTADARAGAGPVWSGPGTSALQLRLPTGSRAVDLAVHALPADPGDAVLPGATASAPLPAAARPVPTRTVRPRSAWGSPGWSYRACPSGPTATRPVEAVVVHHTVTSTSYGPDQVDDALRAIHAFHTRTRGWCDIAYNLVVDRFGRAWEGRTGPLVAPIRGGHARGFNTATTGVALLGDFHAHGVPAAARDAVSLLAAWRAAGGDFDPRGSLRRTSGGSTSIPRGTTVVLPRILGHGDVSSSSCPGRHARALLPEIRDGAARALDPPPAFRLPGGRVPLVGDWTGDGPGAATWTGGTFELQDGLVGGAPDAVVRFGLPGDVPVAGDWDGDGVDTVGVWRDGALHLLTANRTPGPLQLLSGERTVRPLVPDGFPVDRALPLVGDWDGDGVDEPGLVADGDVVLHADSGGTRILHRTRPGRAGDVAVVGDFDVDGRDDVALVRDGVLYAPGAGGRFDLRAVHDVGGAVLVTTVDWSGLGLPTLLSVGPDGRWDPTTPAGR